MATQTPMLPGLGGGTGGVQLSSSTPLTTPTMSTGFSSPTTIGGTQTTTPQTTFTSSGTATTQPTVQQQAPLLSASGGAILPQGPMPQPLSVTQILNSPVPATEDLAAKYGTMSTAPAVTTDTAKKYNEAYQQLNKTEAPATNPRQEISTALSGQQKAPEDAVKAFYDSYAGLDPVSKQIYDLVNQELSAPQTRTSYMEEFTRLQAEQGLPALNTELLNIQRIMDGTEDDIRAEITNAGGFATESQVLALAGARNKTLLRQATFLEAQIAMKNDLVDRIMDFSQLDREEVEKQLDRKLGLLEKLSTIQEKMKNATKENYNAVIRAVGYDGLVDSFTSQEDLNRAAQALGISPQMLVMLAEQPTDADRAYELDKLQYELSVAKFEEDKREFGLSYALEAQKEANKAAASAIVSPYQKERSTRNLESIASIKKNVGMFTTGAGSLLSFFPGSDARNFAAEVDTLKANIAFSELGAMRDASKTGGALGAISERELMLLESSLGALDPRQSPAAFRTQLDKVEENIVRWNAQALALEFDFDYQQAIDDGWEPREIYDYLNR